MKFSRIDGFIANSLEDNESAKIYGGACTNQVEESEKTLFTVSDDGCQQLTKVSDNATVQVCDD